MVFVTLDYIMTERRKDNSHKETLFMCPIVHAQQPSNYFWGMPEEYSKIYQIVALVETAAPNWVYVKKYIKMDSGT